MELTLYKEYYKIVKLKQPLNVRLDGVYFYSQTSEEYSLVCSENVVMSIISDIESGYRLFKIEGVLDFSLIGIISKISVLLANNGISIFVISTFNTDYFMIKNSDVIQGISLFEANGYSINLLNNE